MVSQWLILLLLFLSSMVAIVNSWKISSSSVSRREFWKSTTVATIVATTISHVPSVALAAPPIAIIAEELGYFPVTNRQGETVYVPKSVQRESSEQSIALAQHLRTIGARMYSAYWCPHCARQRELFGRQAWNILQQQNDVVMSSSSAVAALSGDVVSIECSPKGYRNQAALCLPPINSNIDGFPTWKIRNKYFGGEQDLSALAQLSGFPGVWNDALETNKPPLLGSSSCR